MDSVVTRTETEHPVETPETTTSDPDQVGYGQAWDQASNDPVMAGPEDTAPDLDQYKSIGAPNANGAGTISFQTKDGENVLVSESTNPTLYDQVVQDGQTLSAIATAGMQGYDLADPETTAPSLNDYNSIGAPDEVGPGLIEFETQGGDKVLVSQQTNPELYDQVSQDSQTLTAIGSSQVEGYDLADAETTAPALTDYAGIGPADEVGDGLIRYETQSGDKVIVSQQTNPELYDQVKSDYDTMKTLNEAADNGYSMAGADATLPKDLNLDSVTDLGNDVLQYETEGGDKVAVSKDINPDLYQQVSTLGEQKDGITALEDAGYKLADSGAEAPALTEYKGVRPPDEMGEGLIGYTDTEGNKVVVSQANNPELFDQVKADYEKIQVISQSKEEGYTLANDQYSQAPDFSRVGSPDEFGNGMIRFETASGDKFVVSQDINPQLYDAAVQQYNDWTS